MPSAFHVPSSRLGPVSRAYRPDYLGSPRCCISTRRTQLYVLVVPSASPSPRSRHNAPMHGLVAVLYLHPFLRFFKHAATIADCSFYNSRWQKSRRAPGTQPCTPRGRVVLAVHAFTRSEDACARSQRTPLGLKWGSPYAAVTQAVPHIVQARQGVARICVSVAAVPTGHTAWEGPAAPPQLGGRSGARPHHVLEIRVVRLLGPQRYLACCQLNKFTISPPSTRCRCSFPTLAYGSNLGQKVRRGPTRAFLSTA